MALLGLMLWCEPCGVGWSASAGRFCTEPTPDGGVCGLPGTGASLIYKCTTTTGLAVEGAKYQRDHPGWQAPT